MESYITIQKLGTGSLSDVWKVKTKDNSKFAAMKVAEVGLNYEEILNEIDILKQVQHDHVVKYLDSFSLARGNPCLIMEYCDQGSLQDFIVSLHNIPYPRHFRPLTNIGRPLLF